MRTRDFVWFLTLTTLVLGGGLVPAAAAESDPKAMEALVKVRRELLRQPAVRIATTLKLTVRQGETDSDEQMVKATFVHRRNGPDEVQLRGYTCWFDDGVFRAIHEKNEDAFFEVDYDGSPYWALWDVFRDLPFPHVGLLWGEDDAGEMLMQLHPKTPEMEVKGLENRTRDGRSLEAILLEGPDGTLELLVDPATRRLVGAEHVITGGAYVQQGATIRSVYAFACEDLPAADADGPALADRQRVDMFVALAPPPEPPAARAAGGGAPDAGPAGLAGAPAPEFILATADGEAVALEELAGKVVVLDFWATWCGPCRRALPLLHEVAEWADDEGLPVAVFAVNCFELSNPTQNTPDARLEAAKAFWKAKGFTLPVLMDYTDEVAGRYGVQGIPSTFVIRSDGTVHAQHTGAGSDFAETLKREIGEALDAVAGGE